MSKHPPHSIILFDGVCNLCNFFVQFVIKRDPKEKFLFCALQSEKGKSLLKELNYQKDSLSSVILITSNKVYIESTAALRIIRELRTLWVWTYIFIIVPEPVRNRVYRWIARNRYKWFGKKEQCMIPTDELKNRFLE